MDGVIIDSEPLHARAAVMAAKQYNTDITIEYCYGFIGTTTYHMCQKMIEEFHMNATPEELLQTNNKMKELLVKSEGYPAIPYITQLIQNLYSHGMKLIIASSSPADAIEYVMHSLNIKEYFTGYISGMSVPNPKPAPDIFLAAAKYLEVTPEECIVIEDSMNGANAAYAAGIPCIGYLNPNSGNQDLSKAILLVEGFEEIDYHFINSVFSRAFHESSLFIETDRLILKELTVDDAEDLYQLYQKPDIKRFIDDISDSPETEREKLKAYIQYVYQYYGYGLWGVFLKSNMKLIGRCGFELKSFEGFEEYELGYLIGEEYQGNGYAMECTEAVIQYFFEHYNAPRMIAVIDGANSKSLKLAQKLDMVKFGKAIRYNRNCELYERKRPKFLL